MPAAAVAAPTTVPPAVPAPAPAKANADRQAVTVAVAIRITVIWVIARIIRVVIRIPVAIVRMVVLCLCRRRRGAHGQHARPDKRHRHQSVPEPAWLGDVAKHDTLRLPKKTFDAFIYTHPVSFRSPRAPQKIPSSPELIA